VCRTDVSREALIAQLLASDVSSDPHFKTAAGELNAVKATLDEATDVANRLSTAHESVEQANAGLNAWSERWSRALRVIADALQQRLDWDDAVRESVTHAAQLAHSLGASPKWSQPSPESVRRIIEAARGLADACKDGEAKLNRSRDELNRGVREASGLLPQLSALRDIVLAQITLNDIRWDANWQAHADDEVKCQVVAQWQEAVKEMIKERSSQLSSLNDEILGDPGVVGRFSRLLSETGHPLLTAPKLGSHEVSDTAGGNSMPLTPAKSRDSRLSEGYTVMVNLAALVAITGYVRDGQRHRAGWLLLDEPTNGLDEDNRKLVARYLGSLTTEDMPRQIVVTTFDTEFARMLMDSARKIGRRRTIKVPLFAWNGRFPQRPDCVPQ
jgi:DNA repair exonuclease SbcCD ATPase subunit